MNCARFDSIDTKLHWLFSVLVNMVQQIILVNWKIIIQSSGIWE